MIIGLVVIAALVAFTRYSAAREEKRRAAEALEAAARDSMRVEAVIDQPDTASIEAILYAEEQLRQAGHAREHDALHRAYVQAQLGRLNDAAQEPLARAGVGASAMAAIDTFYTAAQRRQFTRDTATLNRAARQALRDQERAERERAIEARKAYAIGLERQLLSEGMDFTVRTGGTDHTSLRMEWVLVSRPFVYQMQNDGEAMQALRSLGFKQLRIGDGYDESWVITL